MKTFNFRVDIYDKVPDPDFGNYKWALFEGNRFIAEGTAFTATEIAAFSSAEIEEFIGENV